MKPLNVFKNACLAVSITISSVPMANAVGGNGSGNEPPNVNSWSVCDVIPMMCATTSTGGNGSGNEPD